MSETVWSVTADELVADGEWHDGLEVFRRIAASVPPGTAFRRAESVRARAANTDEDGNPLPRKKYRSETLLIRYGQRDVAQGLMHNRLRDGQWESDPKPLPPQAWTKGGWKVRDVRVGRIAVSQAAEICGVSKAMAMELVYEEPALEHRRAGRITYLIDLVGFERRVAEHRIRTAERRRNASRRAAIIRASKPRPGYSLTQLAEHSHLTSKTVRHLWKANPELGWVCPASRGAYLPFHNLDAWDTIVQEHKDTEHERRSAAARKVRAEQRAKAAKR